MHLCYGSFVEEHLVEPLNPRCCVELANAAVARVARAMDYIHMPVPRIRTDDDFYRPLDDLDSGDTKLYLGLLHDESLDANLRRIKTAEQFASGFGVAAECGFGRASPDDIP